MKNKRSMSISNTSAPFSNTDIQHTLQNVLHQRKEEDLLRYLQVNEGLIDFCSNDYLSFARSKKIREQTNQYADKLKPTSGSTGSRSISGNTSFAEELEQFLANFHNSEAALLFNSGYDANVGFFSCIATKHDTIICDELIHASIIDGCRLSYANRFRFQHNNMFDLEKKLQLAQGNIFVAVESVYSMDGDIAPLQEVVQLCKKYNANLVVDEAHATGVFGSNGKGLVNHFQLENDVFARVHTFGKAMGCHGAVIVGSAVLRNYLINFARSFIFTTALPIHSLISIRVAYEQLMESGFNNTHLHQLIQHFKQHWNNCNDTCLIDGICPVQSLIIPGSERARNIAGRLQKQGFDVRAIIPPSVPKGKERLRISLHMHNTFNEIDQLQSALKAILNT
ncbi:MAG TPA: 8-amino-7-oxononanoate synthase [Lacibacter sp.]|nr:8-amino-7-oxononanoate synthase [Lacibacter sp.]